MTTTSKPTRCPEQTKNGKTCNWALWEGGPLCVAHSAKAGVVSAQEEMARRGRKGRKQAMEQLEDAKATSIPLRTKADCLTVLEHEAVKVRNSGGDVTQRAKTTTAIVQAAYALIKDLLEEENGELRSIIATHPTLAAHPQLRKQLTVVK